LRVRQRHCAVLFVALSYFVVACGNSSDSATPSNAGSGNNNGSGGNSPGNGGAGNGMSGGSQGGNGPGTHATGLVKLNLKVR
jgi:hypothetical protein